MYKFECIQAASDRNPDKDFNEDSFFFLEDAALVLDGSTGLGPPLLDEKSDGAWLVEVVERRLRQLQAHQGSLLEKLTSVLTSISGVADFAELKKTAPYRMPSAGLVALDWYGDAPRLLRFGDCRAFINRGGRVQEVFPRSPLEDLDQKAINAFSAIMAAGASLDEAESAISGILKKHRSMMNTTGGYGVMTPDPDCVEFAEVRGVDLQVDDRVLLATDGFLSISDVYHEVSAEQVFEVMEGGGLGELFQKIRQIEHSDPDHVRFPRIKKHDDATAALLIVSRS